MCGKVSSHLQLFSFRWAVWLIVDVKQVGVEIVFERRHGKLDHESSAKTLG